jgi:putative YphP/YqiW family bacilliredoxin
MQPPLYDPEAVRPMWEELVQVGFESLETAEEVEDRVTRTEGTTLLMINSVCGCAAGNARPGVALSLQHSVIPFRMITVFAGVFRDAVDKARELMPQVPPSSPFVALFRDAELVYCLQRSQIEMMDALGVATALTQAYDEFCSQKGPSIPHEEFEKIISHQQCGSTIPAFRQD